MGLTLISLYSVGKSKSRNLLVSVMFELVYDVYQVTVFPVLIKLQHIFATDSQLS